MKNKLPEKVNSGFPVSEGLGHLQVEIHYFFSCCNYICVFVNFKRASGCCLADYKEQ